MSQESAPILDDAPHRRYDPLDDSWVLVSPGRTKRPWHGARADAAPHRSSFDPDCYLCPGATRASGATNPAYADIYLFENDFAALRPGTTDGRFIDGMLRAEGEPGECRVICFSPRHDLSLGAMAPLEITRIVDVWAQQTRELGKRYRWVQIFENRGAEMGASSPHPHGQIWAASSLPVQAERERRSQAMHHASKGRPLLLDYATHESGGPRVVVETDAWQVVVPFWAAWPFETLLIAKGNAARLEDLRPEARDDLAAVLSQHITAYDRMLGEEFPYSMGWHQAPGGVDAPGWQLHAHFYPPLLRAGVRKFMVGYELLAEPQRDITPESAAKLLRASRRLEVSV